MRSDMIGPRRLQPAKTEDSSNPIFVLVNEDPHRVLKSLVMPGVTEGQMNGVMPRSPSTRPGLFVTDMYKSCLSSDVRADEWANQFLGTPFYIEALELLKQDIDVKEQREKGYRQREKGYGNNSAEGSKIDKIDREIRQKMLEMEKKLIDHRITESKQREKLEKVKKAAPVLDPSHQETPIKTRGGGELWAQGPAPKKQTEAKKIDLGTAPTQKALDEEDEETKKSKDPEHPMKSTHSARNKINIGDLPPYRQRQRLAVRKSPE